MIDPSTKSLFLGLKALFVLSILSFSFNAAAQVSLEFQEGSRWTYEKSDGTVSSRTVERIHSKSSEFGTFHYALLRRSNGPRRFILRGEKDFFECKDLVQESNRISCVSPLLFAKWPLKVGEQWTSSDIEFNVLEESQTKGPDQRDTRYFRVAYQPIGSDSPIGEVWLSPRWGNLRIDEGDDTYELVSFSSGSGPALPITSTSVLNEMISPTTLDSPQASIPIRLKLRSEWITPIGIALILLVPIVFLLVGVMGALRKHHEEDLPQPNPDEEMKLLSAIARGGDYSQARERLRELSKQFPHYPDIRHQLALVYRAEGRVEEAKKTWIEVLEKKGDYPDARLGLAALYFATGDFEEASLEYQEILNLHPEYADARLGLGKSLYRMGQEEEALEALEEALRINPNYEEARRLLDSWRESAQAVKTKSSGA